MEIGKKEIGDIVSEYKLAKNRLQQIDILAELYATNTAKIRGILYEAGVYEISPEEIAAAARRIIDDGLSFGSLRNYRKAFNGHDAKSAKKVFKDYAFLPWPQNGEPEECNDLKRIQEIAKKAIEVADERAKHGGRKPQQDLVPAPCVPAAPFTDEQAAMLIAGMLSLLAEQEAIEKQLKYTIEQLQRKANDLIKEAEAKTKELLDLDKKVAEGRMLLEMLRDEQEKRKNA